MRALRNKTARRCYPTINDTTFYVCVSMVCCTVYRTVDGIQETNLYWDNRRYKLYHAFVLKMQSKDKKYPENLKMAFGGFLVSIPTRSRQTRFKQVCLDNLACDIRII